MVKKKENEVTMTRAEKTDAAKKIILKLLKKASYKSTELIDLASEEYAKAYENGTASNDVKGRIGSVLDVMKKDGEVLFEGGRYEMKPAKTPKKRTTKAEKQEESKEENAEKPVKAKRTAKAKKTEEQSTEVVTEEVNPLPPAPLQPIAPTAPTSPETAPVSAPKKRGRKPKAETKTEVKEITEEPKAEQPPAPTEITVAPVEEKQEEKAEKDASPKGTLMDMSFLFGEVKKPSIAPKVQAQEKPQEKKTEQQEKPVAKPQEKKAEQPAVKQEKTVKTATKTPVKPTQKQPVKPTKTADEKQQEAYLERLHKLGGDYFEYYSVYLLERYSRQNGRRLEALKISGGDNDGGIDGEIELTDKLGFRETIYIQAKNWDADKGNKSKWVVGETLLQQFLGACACRQRKDGKQNTRGIFITTSHFTPDAQKLLDLMSDKLVGYDGADLYETAKECSFGVVKKNGEWALDEELLSGKNAFFRRF